MDNSLKQILDKINYTFPFDEKMKGKVYRRLIGKNQADDSFATSINQANPNAHHEVFLILHKQLRADAF